MNEIAQIFISKIKTALLNLPRNINMKRQINQFSQVLNIVNNKYDEIQTGTDQALFTKDKLVNGARIISNLDSLDVVQHGVDRFVLYALYPESAQFIALTVKQILTGSEVLLQRTNALLRRCKPVRQHCFNSPL